MCQGIFDTGHGVEETILKLRPVQRSTISRSIVSLGILGDRMFTCHVYYVNIQGLRYWTTLRGSYFTRRLYVSGVNVCWYLRKSR